MLNQRALSGFLIMVLQAPMAFAVEFPVSATLKLALPAEAPTAKCAPVAGGRDPATVTMQRSFLEPFESLDLSAGRWTSHYDAGYDASIGRWLDSDGSPAKRTLQGNHEQQLYVDPGYRGTASKPLGLDPFRLRNGVLSIVAQRTPPELRGALYDYEFVSGLLTTRASLVQRYGYFEMRARIPAGKALWPAFWLLPADKSWPPEIDILEVVGQQAELMVTTTHWAGADGKRQASGCRTRLVDAATGFHLFGMLWTEQRIVWYFDREPVAQLATPPGVDKPMYMVLNLAVGGNMVGRADAETPLPASFDIDWVVAYTLPEHPACEPRRSAQESKTCQTR